MICYAYLVLFPLWILLGTHGWCRPVWSIHQGIAWFVHVSHITPSPHVLNRKVCIVHIVCHNSKILICFNGVWSGLDQADQLHSEQSCVALCTRTLSPSVLKADIFVPNEPKQRSTSSLSLRRRKNVMLGMYIWEYTVCFTRLRIRFPLYRLISLVYLLKVSCLVSDIWMLIFHMACASLGQ